MSASLKNLGIFLIQGQRSISGSNMIIQQIKVGTSVLHKFHCEFACAIHFLNYFNYSRSSSRSKGQFRNQVKENIIFTKKS